MKKIIQMNDRVYLGVPPVPPLTLLLVLFTINISFAFNTARPIAFNMFAAVYGLLMLASNLKGNRFPKYTITMNFLVLFLVIAGYRLHKKEQCIIFIILCIIQHQFLFAGLYDIFLSLFYRPVYFETVFFAIQLGILFDYLAYFTNLNILKTIPHLIRICLNCRVLSLISFIGIIRFTIKIIVIVFMERNSNVWIYTHILLSIWETGIDYRKQFRIRRLFQKNGAHFYPKPLILGLFGLDCVLQWVWYFGKQHSRTFVVIKRTAWNYLKVQSRAAQRPGRSIIRTILLKYLDDREVESICL